MNSTASPNRDVSSCVSEWQLWGLDFKRKPVIEKKFLAGESNQNFLLGDGEQQCVLRLYAIHGPLEFDRKIENTIQQTVSGTGLAPNIFYIAPDASYLVMEFIDAETIGSDSEAVFAVALKHDVVSDLCLAVGQFHAVNIDLHQFSYTGCLAHYWQQLVQVQPQDSTAENQHRDLMLAAQHYEKIYGMQRSLCHHDLNAHNILANRQGQNIRFTFIDWEFAGNGIASMDFAALSQELNIDINVLSDCTGHKTEELKLAKRLYNYLCTLYNLLSSQ